MTAPLRRAALLVSCCGALYLLYFFGLARAGMLGPDEPRYAAIGREMARSGDWITPRLFGSPWFEKPALLYWMTGIGFELGLGDDLAPRVPVAIASVAFLVFFFALMRREWNTRAAWFASAVLATSAGWLAFSRVAVTDLPMTAAFSAAMLLTMSGAAPIAAGILLGIAVLAKGLVPVVLFIPALWYWRRRPLDLFIVAIAAVAVALPWYALVTLRNGPAFLQEFFVKHHFARFATPALQHVQPFWFYVPVLLGLLYPWTPALALITGRKLYRDRRAGFLLLWAAFALVFFSAAENKLPGYILPMLPPVAVLIGVALARARTAAVVLACCAALLWMVPVIAAALPRALTTGATHTRPAWFTWESIPALALAAIVFFVARRGRVGTAFGLTTASAILAVAMLVWQTYPVLDHMVSARGFWRARGRNETNLCVDSPNRRWRYGLDYYANRIVPNCP